MNVSDNGRHGVALIAVLWVILCLVTVVLLFAESMRFEYRAGMNAVSGLQAGQAVDGARRYLQVVLDSHSKGRGALPLPEDYRADGVPLGDSLFWVIGRADADTNPGRVEAFGFVDEGSKLNLNTATAEMLERLPLPGMTPEIAAAIVDWRDEDSEVEPGGAESETYSLKNPPYECKNGPFETVEELRLVHGVTWELLYGEDVNRNGVLDANENDGDRSYPPDNGDGVLQFGLLEYVTVYSRIPNTGESGQPRINVSNLEDTQTRQRLTTLLEEKLPDRAGEILEALGAGTVNSPLQFFVRSRMTPEEFKLIEKELTASDGDFVEGRVNVNTAPAAVLACLPGMDEALAQQLVLTRRSKSVDELDSVAWAAEVLGDAVGDVGPHLTGETYRLSADIAAVDRNGRGLRRAWVVYDTTGDKARVIYRRDGGSLGWPLGPRDELLQTAARMGGSLR